jgi:hypothetical protein
VGKEGVVNDSATVVIPPVTSGDGPVLIQDVNAGESSLTEGVVGATQDVPAAVISVVESAVGVVAGFGPERIALLIVVVLGVCAMIFQGAVMILVRDEL